jgi:ATP-dependent Clp protease ATP-binding subunit ClpA
VQLNRIATRLAHDPGIILKWDESLVKFFLKEDYDTKFGMRALCKFVEEAVLSALSEAAILQKQPLKGEIVLKVQRDKIVVRFNG